MKRLLSVLLAALLCFGAAVLPAAAEDAAAPEPTAQIQEETPEPQEEPTEPIQEDSAEQETHRPLSPYQRPDRNDYAGDNAAYAQDLKSWENSIYARYYHWRSSVSYARIQYEKAFRAFYADDPDLLIEDHFVFKKVHTVVYENRKRVKRTYAVILDYFDTDEAEAFCTTLRIPAELDGDSVLINMCCDLYDDMDATASIGYANDTVKKLVLEEGPTAVSDYAFSNFTALRTVYLPASVKKIANGAFRNCRSLRKVVVRGALETIGCRAFENCESLHAFDALKSVAYLHARAFASSGLRSVTLCGGVWTNYIDEDLESCSANGETFADCKQLKTVTYTDPDEASRHTWLDIAWHCFDGCTALQKVTLPAVCSRVSICEYAFNGCTALNKVAQVQNLKRIYNNAFKGCSALQSFVVPIEIEFAENDAFAGCSSLQRLYVHSTNAALLKYSDYDDGDLRGREITGSFIDSLPKTCTIFVANKEMKYTFKTTGYRGPVKIRVYVPAPETVKIGRKNDTVTFKWSKVKTADGYRIWSYNARTGKYKKLATVKAPKTTVTLQSNAKRFVIRAYRIEAGDVSWSLIKAVR